MNGAAAVAGDRAGSFVVAAARLPSASAAALAKAVGTRRLRGYAASVQPAMWASARVSCPSRWPRWQGQRPGGQPAARFSRISNAGSVLPSSTSRKAPPPVLM